MESLEQLSAVQRMQRYIDEHLFETISLADLARKAEYSPFYSARIFKELTGKAPFAYIRALRLSQAALILRDESPKILDMALDAVFDSHEGFTRAFSKQFGVTPHKYKSSPQPIHLFMPYHVRESYFALQKGELPTMPQTEKRNTIFVQIVEREARKMLIRRTDEADDYFAYCEKVGCDIWGLLSSVKEALYEPVAVWLPKPFRPEGTSYYAQGVEVPANYAGVVPQQMELIDLPACKMMVFQGLPFTEETFSSACAEVEQAIENYDPTLYGFVWAPDDGPRFQLEPQGPRGYIEALPVRQMEK